jgi:hypothetical protein
LSTNTLTTLGNISNSLSQLNAPAPVAAPQNSSILGVPTNTNLSNLAALSNVVGGLTSLGGVSALSNPLLSTAAAASLNSLGINLNAASAQNDVQNQNQQGMNQSFNAYNTSGGSSYNPGNRNDDMSSFGGSQIRNYNTSNDDYNNSRNFGGSSVSRKPPSDTILVRNVSTSVCLSLSSE